MPESSSPNPPQPEPNGVPPRRTPQSWQTLADERIREAMAAGAFDNLPGAGKPLNLDENSYAGDRQMAFHVLKSSGTLPRELELGKEIDGDQAQIDRLLAELRHRRDTLATKRFVTVRDKRAYNGHRLRARDRYEAMLRERRSRVLTLNISAPAALHRDMVDVDARLADFDAEFPAVAETEERHPW
jgi:DnaJ family protein C protein 28